MHLRLRDGVNVVLRPIRPDDKAMLARGMERLSPTSRYKRFLTAKPRLTSADLRYLTEIDYVDHYAVVAVFESQPTVLAGVGRWVRDPQDPTSAEIAVVVADELQGQALGTGLGLALVEAARTRGIARFTAVMLPENIAAQRLLAHLLQRLEIDHQSGLYELTGELAA